MEAIVVVVRRKISEWTGEREQKISEWTGEREQKISECTGRKGTENIGMDQEKGKRKYRNGPGEREKKISDQLPR